MLDDLESALLQAGAIRAVDDEETPGEQRLERVPLVQEEEEAVAESTPASAGALSAEVADFVTSAPGKVILFGEHAVVHGVTAIAGALDLRCYCHVERRSDERISLILPDFGYERSWAISELPFDSLQDASDASDVENDTLPNSTGSPNPNLLATLAGSPSLAAGNDATAQKVALSAQSFLYLYMRLAKNSKKHARTFTVRSTLPIGAGLGSSAAFSVSLASALLYLNGHLSFPAYFSTPVSSDATSLVNAWAFVGEKIIHGNPSGVDNSVSTLGGALTFQKALVPGESPKMNSLHHFKSIRFLLTDTKVPRDTKTLVAGVSKRKAENPDKIDALLQEVQAICDKAVFALDSTDVGRRDQMQMLEKLVDRNHDILNELGVGHASLEAIRAKASLAPYHLHTKLTGAGGGGCAVTIVPDDFSEELLVQLKEELEGEGFKCYETAVGGAGFALLPLQKAAPHESAEGGAESDVVPVRAKFENASGDELVAWAKEAGTWQFA